MKTQLIVWISLLGAMVAPGSDVPLHVATTPVPREEPEWRERVEALNALSKEKGVRVAFVGDSITEMWALDDVGKSTWEKYWAPLGAANFGIAGDRTEHVLWRLDHGNLDGLSPRVIVLMIGTNNAGQQFEDGGYRCTAEQTADGIRAIIGKLKKKCPGAKILLMAIFPRGEEESDPARRQNDATNDLIRGLADSKTVFFMDIGKRFLKPNGDGEVTIMPDMLHLSDKGYRIWAEAMRPVVHDLLR